MKLIEALRTVASSQTHVGAEARFYLATGFTPLHLQTFLHAHLQTAHPQNAIRVDTGIFGDLIGNIARAQKAAYAGMAVTIEWSDLDPRLGLRSAGGWTPEAITDVMAVASAFLVRIEDVIQETSTRFPVAVSTPTLPLPPVTWQPGWQAGVIQLQLEAAVAATAARLAALPRVSVVSRARLDRLSPTDERLDVRSDLSTGFPYRNAHADAMAELFSHLLRRAEPKKGLITDLDDTLWSGILGETGVSGVCWDLSSHAQTHALYQQLLRSLSSAGVLVGVASKNEPELVKNALLRPDLLIDTNHLFPIEASWGAKSVAVARILEKWNIGADAVVFVDDSPLELEEVRTAHPGIECILFPKNDPQRVWELLWTLRDCFGKSVLREEDTIRLQSLRQAAVSGSEERNSALTSDEVLASSGARVTLHISRDVTDERAFELVNKTNQFNLNGVRYSVADWQRALARPDAFLMTVVYEDKFGPLGKIGVVLGTAAPGSKLMIDQWVLSCRAFSRRIEFQILSQLFSHFDATVAELAFCKTERNGPLQEFLGAFPIDATEPPVTIPRSVFDASLPALFHAVTLTEAIDKEVAYAR